MDLINNYSKPAGGVKTMDDAQRLSYAMMNNLQSSDEGRWEFWKDVTYSEKDIPTTFMSEFVGTRDIPIDNCSFIVNILILRW